MPGSSEERARKQAQGGAYASEEPRVGVSSLHPPPSPAELAEVAGNGPWRVEAYDGERLVHGWDRETRNGTIGLLRVLRDNYTVTVTVTEWTTSSTTPKDAA